MVYLALRRKSRDVSYFDDDGECDFIVRERHAVTSAVQACTVVTDENRDREIGGLLKALDFYSLSQGTIVTLKQRDQLVIDGKTIRLVPFSDWSSLTV